MIERLGDDGDHHWVVISGETNIAFLLPYDSGEPGYKLFPMKGGRVRYFKTFNRAMKALKKYDKEVK